MGTDEGQDGWAEERGSAFSGARWHAVGSGTLQAVRLLVTLVIARLVSPADIGVMAIALSVAEILEVMKDMGTGRAIVQRENLTRRMYDSIFVLNLLLGVIIATALALGADLVATLYRGEETGQLPDVLRLLAVMFLVNSTVQAQTGLLTRRMAFGRLAAANLTGAGANGAVAIVLAWQGFGVWALALGYLAGAVAITATLLALNPWRPRFRMHWEDLRAVSHFSLNLTGANLFSYVLGNVDTLIISRFLGPTALGYYAIARRLIKPAHAVTNVLIGVTSPALARVQKEHGTLRRDFLRASAGLAFIIFPSLVGMAVVAEPFVLSVLGEVWLPAVPVVQFYALLTLVFLVTHQASVIYFVTERTDILLRWTIGLNCMFVLSWWVGSQYGVTGVAAGGFVAVTILLLPGIHIPLQLIEMHSSAYLRAMWPFALATIGMAGIAFVTRLACQGWTSNHLIILVATVAVGVVCYAGFILWLRPTVLIDLRRLLGLRAA